MGNSYAGHVRKLSKSSQVPSQFSKPSSCFDTKRQNAHDDDNRNMPPVNVNRELRLNQLSVFPDSDSQGPSVATDPIQTKRLSQLERRSNITSNTLTVGEQLPRQLRRTMERAFCADFCNLRVHEGTDAKSLGAIAFTRGREIHFAPGEYAQHSLEGQKSIGHELAHVVQQRRKIVPLPPDQQSLVNSDPVLENQADSLGEQAARGEHAKVGNLPVARNVNITELDQPNDAGGAIQLGKNRRTRIRQGYLKRNCEGGKLKVSQPEKLMRSPRIRETKLRI